MEVPKKLDETSGNQRVPFWTGAALLLVLLVVVIVPTLDLGFVSDDFVLLVNDQRLPLTQSVDELHRPLRNATLKIAGSQLGIQHVWPYRLVVAGTFLAALVLLFQLTRLLGANRIGALAAVYLLAFFPRNQEVLFWFAAWQDLVAAVAVLCACLLFVDFRESKRVWPLVISSFAYVVAIGFKETAVVLPALLVVIDLYRERSIASFWKRSFLRAYIPFTVILLAYVAYYFSDAGLASLAGRRTAGEYGFRGFTSAFAGLIRAVINLALPYSTRLGFKDIHFWHVAVILFEAGLVLLLVRRLHMWSALIMAAGWLVCAITPTATFAATFNADRYLFLPLLGAAIFFGLSVHAMTVPSRGTKYSLFIYAALALYTSAGVRQLVISRGLCRQAGIEAAMVIGETMRLSSKLPVGSEVDFVNVTHALDPRAPVFLSGLSEALHANGLSLSIRILRNYSAPDSEQQDLVAKLLRCVAAPPDAPGKRTVLLENGGRLLNPSTECASRFVDSDRARRPGAWALLYPGR
jgi:hypothetical protein